MPAHTRREAQVKLRAFIEGVPFLGWAVVYTGVCWGLFGAILGAVTPELRRELADYQQLGLLMMAWSTGNLIGALQGGRLAQRHAPRKLFLTYCSAALGALAVIVFARHFTVLLLGFFVIALFETAMFTFGHSILAGLSTDPVTRARLLSMIDVAYSTGNLITPLVVIGLQAFGDDWRRPYQAFTLPLVGALLLFAPRRPYALNAAVPAGGGHAEEALAPPVPYLALLRRPAVLWAVVAGVLAGFVEWGQNFWYVSYAIHVQQLGANAARVGLQAFVAGMVVARCVQAFVHSTWTLRQRLWRLNVMALAGLGLGVLWPGHGWFALYAGGNFLLGLGIGVVFPVLLAIMIDELPAQASRLSALLMVSFTLGTQSAGLLIGTLCDRFGLHAGYATLLMAALGFTIAAWRLCRPFGQRPSPDLRSGTMHL